MTTRIPRRTLIGAGPLAFAACKTADAEPPKSRRLYLIGAEPATLDPFFIHSGSSQAADSERSSVLLTQRARMSRRHLICLLSTLLLCCCSKPVPQYGSNPAAGGTFMHEGIRLYYETYGAGEPLLLVHGNGSSIGSFKAQIDHFRKRCRVIAMDGRDHGESADSSDQLTYEKMTDDFSRATRSSPDWTSERIGLERRRYRGTAPRNAASGKGEENCRDGRYVEAGGTSGLYRDSHPYQIHDGRDAAQC